MSLIYIFDESSSPRCSTGRQCTRIVNICRYFNEKARFSCSTHRKPNMSMHMNTRGTQQETCNLLSRCTYIHLFFILIVKQEIRETRYVRWIKSLKIMEAAGKSQKTLNFYFFRFSFFSFQFFYQFLFPS